MVYKFTNYSVCNTFMFCLCIFGLFIYFSAASTNEKLKTRSRTILCTNPILETGDKLWNEFSNFIGRKRLWIKVVDIATVTVPAGQ